MLNQSILQAIQLPPGGTPLPVTAALARSLPGVAKAIAVIANMGKQMPMQAYKGARIVEPRPAILSWPDPGRTPANFVDVALQDYLLHGNVITLDTTWAASGYPSSTVWLPAERCGLVVDPLTHERSYWFDGTPLDTDRVCHVRRGADPALPERGIGVVEQHLSQLGKVRDQEDYEAQVLQQGAVPSVAVIAPNPEVSQEAADAAKASWKEKFGGPVREPAILPAGTQVIPLSWSPVDSEMTEARKLSLLDVANMFGLDGYWLGAPAGSSLTYRSPGPLYLTLLRQTVSPIITELEQAWGRRWLPHGTDLRFDRRPVLQDDMTTVVAWVTKLVEGGLMSPNEGREQLGLAPLDDPDADVARPRPKSTTIPLEPTEEGNPDD